ncbi:MAG: cyclic nucleotide-binding domain-containing protein [Bryobacteraceae bacterium]
MRKALYLMGILDDRDLEWLVKNGEAQFIKSGTTLIQEGGSIDSLYVLLDGKLSVTIGRGVEVASLLSGEIVGEMSFVDSRPPSASVVAIQDCQVLTVPRASLKRRLEEDEAFAARFYRAMAVYLADRLRTTVSRFGYGSAKQDADPHQVDELDDEMMDSMSLAAVRFDELLRRLRVN